MIHVYVLPEVGTRGQDFQDALVISITSPGREHPKIKGNNVYPFHFHDVEQEYVMNDGRVILPMSEQIAQEIVEVAVRNRHCEQWIIHCEAGISRSPAVAIGLSRYIKLEPNRRDLKKRFSLYNKYVCRLVEDAMDKKVEQIVRELAGI